jgi:hypothetical protein
MSTPQGAMGSPYCDGSLSDFFNNVVNKEKNVVNNSGFAPSLNKQSSAPPPPPVSPQASAEEIARNNKAMEESILAARDAKVEKYKFTDEQKNEILNTMIPNGYKVTSITDEKIVLVDSKNKTFTMYPN